jgi:hypothetical protein
LVTARTDADATDIQHSRAIRHESANDAMGLTVAILRPRLITEGAAPVVLAASPRR